MTGTQPPAREPVRCARPGCSSVFTPKSRDHIYCSTLCKKRVFRYRNVLNLPAKGNR